jgi:hypothetical protein
MLHAAPWRPAMATAAVTALTLLLLACCCTVEARIEYARVFRDDRPLIAMTQAFGFGSGGRMDIMIKVCSNNNCATPRPHWQDGACDCCSGVALHGLLLLDGRGYLPC